MEVPAANAHAAAALPPHEQAVFRFKLHEDIINLINNFAIIHQNDDRKTYKQEWSKWFIENNAVLENEINRLTHFGYVVAFSTIPILSLYAVIIHQAERILNGESGIGGLSVCLSVYIIF